MSRIRPEVAKRHIEYFEKRFQKAHLYLAYHAAFPSALTPDLLYRLWANFQRDISGEVLSIPWIAVADLLLSRLCDEVGHELYEMDLAVRNELLKGLKEDEKFGQQRINELSDFLLGYVRQQLQSDDPDIRDFAQVQQLTAVAYTQPRKAARELALAFSKLDRKNTAELVRMASLTETFAEPLAEYQPLLIYARGMQNFARGNLEAAKAQFCEVLEEKNVIQVAGVNLPIPEQIKVNLPFVATPPRKSRLLIWGGISAVFLTAILGIYIYMSFSEGQRLLNSSNTQILLANDLASKIVKYMLAKNYVVFTEPKEYNIVYVEGMNEDGSLNNNAPNQFNDRRMVIEVINKVPKIVNHWQATTEPGSYYTFQPLNPQGVARIAFGQYKAWSVGIHGTAEPQEALIQVAPVTVYRDFNQDFKRTGDKLDTGLFAIDQHWGYDAPVNDIKNASGGNLVGRTRKGHREFMAIIKQDRRYVANPNYVFYTTIIPGDDLVKKFP